MEELSRKPSPYPDPLPWVETTVEMLVDLRRMRTKAGALAATVEHGDLSPFYGFERELFDRVDERFEKLMGWTITHNELPGLNSQDRFIYLSNHPHLTASWPWASFLSKHFGPNMSALGKDDFVNNPLFNWALGGLMESTGKGFFIDQKNRESAIKSVRTQVPKLLSPGTGLALFPDRRPFKGRIRKQQKDWDRKKPKMMVSDWMTETCFPKSGALWALLQGTKEMENLHILNCTVVQPVNCFTHGAGMHMHVEEISRADLLGDDPHIENLNKALVELWKNKNARIRKRRKELGPQLSTHQIDNAAQSN
jgi:hypothetical protein